MPTQIEREAGIAENAAAISDTVYSDRQAFQQLYDTLCDNIGGFVGIWMLIAHCAIELEDQHPGEWNDDYIEMCESIGKEILALTLNHPELGFDYGPTCAMHLITRTLQKNKKT